MKPLTDQEIQEVKDSLDNKQKVYLVEEMNDNPVYGIYKTKKAAIKAIEKITGKSYKDPYQDIGVSEHLLEE